MSNSLYDQGVEKVGGAFKLTVLLQKRVRELVRGATPLVNADETANPIDVALDEILQDKISFEVHDFSDLDKPVIAAKEKAVQEKAVQAEKPEKKQAKEKDKKRTKIAF